MTISQEQFNEIIDLLGDTATELSIHFAMIDMSERASSEQYGKFVANKFRYENAVVKLYGFHTTRSMAEFEWNSLKLEGIGRTASTRKNSDQQTVGCMQFNVPVRLIIKRLNEDFREGLEPLDYTGKYKFIRPEFIISNAAEINKEEHNLPLPDEIVEHGRLLSISAPWHMNCMQIMIRTAATPMAGMILLIVGIAMCASGAVTPGICLAGVGTAVMITHAGRRFGFFASSDEAAVITSPPSNIHAPAV